jgi:hypothetical protein
MTRICVGLLALISLFATSALKAAPAPAPNARIELEYMAGRLTFFDVGNFLFDRMNVHRFPDAVAQEYQKLIGDLTTTNYDVAALVKLLKHDNPRVRTLAMAALFARDDPRLLPYLVPLVDDKAETFSTPMLFSARVSAKKEMPRLEKQTVGQVANRFISLYLEPANYQYGVKGASGEPGFDAYWSAHKDREFCASWFAVQLTRADQRTSPISKERYDKIRAIRKRIDKLPKADRAWTLLWLRGAMGGGLLASDAELVAACKDLGPDRLILMLQRKIPSDDPDVQPRRSNNGAYRGMTMFVLAHASELLRPKDAQTLLDCDAWERDYAANNISDPTLIAGWTIAAAELKNDKAKAKDLLVKAFDHFKDAYQDSERAHLAVALWRLVGPDASKFLVSWFYDNRPAFGHIPHQRSAFLQGIAEQRTKETRKLLVALVKHKGFDTLDWPSLRSFVTIVNAWSDKPVVDDTLMRAAWHPFHESHFDQEIDKAKQAYPKETDELLRTLGQWRAKVRDAVLQWDKE